MSVPRGRASLLEHVPVHRTARRILHLDEAFVAAGGQCLRRHAIAAVAARRLGRHVDVEERPRRQAELLDALATPSTSSAAGHIVARRRVLGE
jgi:hypothetical protein